MAMRSDRQSADRTRRAARRVSATPRQPLDGHDDGSVPFDGLYFAGLGQPLLAADSGIRTFEQADRVLSMFLGRTVSTDASVPGRS